MADGNASRGEVRLCDWPVVDWRMLTGTGALRTVGVVGAVDMMEHRVLEECGVRVVSGPDMAGGVDVVLHTPAAGDSLMASAAATWRIVRLGALRTPPWNRLGRGSLRRWRRQLACAGHDRVRVYWHAPSAARCSYIVDLSDRIAVDAMLRRYQGVRFGALKSVAARLVNRVGLAALLARDVSLVAGPCRSLVPEHSGPHRSALLVTPWFEASRHVISLGIDPATQALLSVAKIPRRPGDEGGIRHEAEMLDELVDRAPGLRWQVPAVQRLASDACPYLLETPMTGSTVGPEYVRKRLATVLDVGFDFVARLPVTGASTCDSTWFFRLIERPLHDLAKSVDLPGLPRLVSRTLARLEPLRSADIPLVFEHGDLSHPNLMLVRADRLGVVDWERSQLRGLPMCDLCFFLQYVAESRRKTFDIEGQLRAFDEVFAGPDAWGTQWLERYASLRGVDPSLIPALILATWARSAAGLVERLGPPSGSGPDDVSAGMTPPVDEMPQTSDMRSAVAGDRNYALWCHALTRFG